jgi:hypothetical protein
MKVPANTLRSLNIYRGEAMIRRPQIPAFLALFSVVFGCSSPDPLEEPGSTAEAAESCPGFTLQVSSTRLAMGVNMAVGVVPPTNYGDFDWDGEGLRIASTGSLATVSCAWAGSHTLDITASTNSCTSTKSVQIECVPATCNGFLSAERCPGVKEQKQPLECPHTNVLVRLPPRSQCPDLSTWDGGAVLPPRIGASEPGPVYCSYYWNAPPEVPPNTDVFAGSSWEWDCPNVAAHGDRAELNAALSAHGQSNLGELTWTANNDSPVHVAVVDTAAGVWSDPDNNPHGKAVGTLIRDTACRNSSNCRVDVRNYLGLPLLRDSETLGNQTVIRRDTTRGGSFGAKGHLAQAIVEAANAAAIGTPTVINLSVAYDTDAPMTDLRPGANDHSNNVVLEALQYARCRGALIFAAAGNGLVPADPTQPPAFPARWTGLNALDTAACVARYGFARFANPTQPLLYAVSAFDFGRQPLMTTRGRGQSVIAALGFAVVREDPNGGYTRKLSGTSMATANVSAIAATYWSHLSNPGNASPDSIVRDLYSVSTRLTSVTPDFRPYRLRTAPQFFVDTRELNFCSIANTGSVPATCTPPKVSATVPDEMIPDLPGDLFATKTEPVPPPPVGKDPWEIPYFRPQPDSDPACESCTIKLGRNRIDLILRKSFKPSSSLRAVVTRASSGIAGFAQGITQEEFVIPIADFDALEVPFSVEVSLEDLAGITAAELTYQVDVEGIDVDTTESMLIEAEPPPL